MIHKEQGRSMIETLAVLAIAGIITLGGLAGYRTAMNKVRANDIAEVISDMLLTAQTQRTDDMCIDLEYLEDSTPPVCVSNIVASRNGIAKITFDSDSDCDSIETLAGSTFGKCRWEPVNGEPHTYYIMPNRAVEGSSCVPQNVPWPTGTGCR